MKCIVHRVELVPEADGSFYLSCPVCVNGEPVMEENAAIEAIKARIADLDNRIEETDRNILHQEERLKPQYTERDKWNEERAAFAKVLDQMRAAQELSTSPNLEYATTKELFAEIHRRIPSMWFGEFNDKRLTKKWELADRTAAELTKTRHLFSQRDLAYRRTDED